MKKFCSILLMCLLILAINPVVESAKTFEEGSFFVGDIFSLNRPDTIYAVSDTSLAELIEKEPGIYAVRCIKPGDVYITAVTKLDGKLVKFVMLAHVKDFDYEEAAENTERMYGDVKDDLTRSYIESVVYLVNMERKKVGAEYLMLYTDLINGCNIRAREISDVYSHSRPDGSSCFTVLKEDYRELGENIAAGYQTPEEVVEGWMSSEGHRKNILNKNFTKIGVGYCHKPGSDMIHYWVQMFGQ